MEEKENIVIEEQTENKPSKAPTILCWISLALALMSPFLGIGLGILSYNLDTKNRSKEVEVVSIIAMMLGGLLFFESLL